MTTTPRTTDRTRTRIDFTTPRHAAPTASTASAAIVPGIITRNHHALPVDMLAAEALTRLASLYRAQAARTLDPTASERLNLAADDFTRLASVAEAYANLTATRHARALRAGA